MTPARISNRRSRMPYAILQFIDPMTCRRKPEMETVCWLRLTILPIPMHESIFDHGITRNMATMTRCSQPLSQFQVTFEVDQSLIGQCRLLIYTALFRVYFNLIIHPGVLPPCISQLFSFWKIASFSSRAIFKLPCSEIDKSFWAKHPSHVSWVGALSWST